MRLTVLGKSPSWQDAGGACSGYLVTHGGFSLLLDCGSGVFGELRSRADYTEIDAVLITHLHADHILDLIPFASALTYGPAAAAGGAARPRPSLHMPPASIGVMRTLGGCWNSPDLVERAFALTEYEPAAGCEIGPFRVRMAEVPHYIPTYAVELTDPDGRRFVFGADCGPNDALVDLARGCDLLMVEATLTEAVEDGEPAGHMTPREAGELAARSGAHRVVITHFSDEVDRDGVRAAAAAGLGSDVALAEAGAEIEL